MTRLPTDLVEKMASVQPVAEDLFKLYPGFEAEMKRMQEESMRLIAKYGWRIVAVQNDVDSRS